MKNKYKKLLTCMFLVNSTVSADWKDSIYIDLYGGVSQISDTDLTLDTSISDAELDLGNYLGGRIGYQYNTTWAFELDYIYRRNDVDSLSGTEFTDFTGGDYASTAVLFNAIYTNRNLEQTIGNITWVPYVGVRFGVLTEADIDIEIAGEETEYSERLFPVAQAMAGINVELNNHLIIIGHYLAN